MNASHVSVLVQRMLRGTARRRRSQQALTTLLSMDDHLLRDIGVSRGDALRMDREGVRGCR